MIVLIELPELTILLIVLLQLIFGEENWLVVFHYVAGDLLEGHLGQHQVEHVAQTVGVTLVEANQHHREVEVEDVETEQLVYQTVRVLLLVPPVLGIGLIHCYLVVGLTQNEDDYRVNCVDKYPDIPFVCLLIIREVTYLISVFVNWDACLGNEPLVDHHRSNNHC